MTGNDIWVCAWLAVTVLAGTGVVLMAPRYERLRTAAGFVGTSLLVWGVFGFLIVLGWWPR